MTQLVVKLTTVTLYTVRASVSYVVVGRCVSVIHVRWFASRHLLNEWIYFTLLGRIWCDRGKKPGLNEINLLHNTKYIHVATA